MDPARLPPAPPPSLSDQLRSLGELRDRGQLSDAEFASAKRLLLGDGQPAPVATWTSSDYLLGAPTPTQARVATSLTSAQPERRTRPAGIVVAFAGVGIVAGCLMPWATAASENGAHDSVSGIEVPGGDSFTLLLIGTLLVLSGIGLAMGRAALLSALTLLLAVSAGVVSCLDINLVRHRSIDINAAQSELVARVGVGLWAIPVFAAIGLIAAVASFEP